MTPPLHYEKPEDMDLAEVPVIDFAAFLSGTPEGKRDTAKAIEHACRHIGFFYLVNHGVPESLRQRVLAQSRLFFAQDFATKMQCAPLLDGQWCGYLPARGAAEGTQPGESLGAKAKMTSVSGGSLEQFNMMRVLGAQEAHFDSTDPIYQHNRWPGALPEFVETMILNQQALTRLGGSLMAALSLALGQEEDYLARFHRHPLATFGLNFYPKPPGAMPEDNVGVGAHCDASTFTVLLQDDVGGLEVKNAAGRWIAAPYVPNAYVINIGDTLMGWTNGYFVSTLHRVVSRKPLDRFSGTMFMNPDDEVTIAPMEKFVNPEHPPRFTPFSNGEYMRRFFVRFYDQMFK